MAEPIGPISQPSFSPQLPKEVPNVPILSKQMRDQVMKLADQLQRIMDDPSLATQDSFLNEFVKNTSNLNRTVNEAILVR